MASTNDPITSIYRESLLHLDNIARKVRNDYPGWSDKDARLTLFNKSFHNLQSVGFMLKFYDGYLNTPDFEKANPSVPKDELISSRREYLTFISLSTIQMISSAIESSFRAIVKHFDAQYSAGWNFWQVYDSLFIITSHDPSDRQLFKLLSLMRNTVHNNGVFLPKKPGDDFATFNAKKYDFIDGATYNVTEFEKNELYKALFDACDKILRSSPIVVEKFIRDPSAV